MEVIGQHFLESNVGPRREYNGNHIRCHQVKSAKWVKSLKIEYDQEADALYIQFKNILP
ncbi:MAG TPA: DUF2283 domain-containing protein [Dehalococcoidia bacterium]|nr:DUF2283 domain-containing protein [Dehalococcoidia bacterium]